MKANCFKQFIFKRIDTDRIIEKITLTNEGTATPLKLRIEFYFLIFLITVAGLLSHLLDSLAQIPADKPQCLLPCCWRVWWKKNPDYFYSLQCSNNVMLLLKCLMVYSASETNFLNPRFLLCFFFKQKPNSYFKVKMCPPLSGFFFLKIKIGK